MSTYLFIYFFLLSCLCIHACMRVCVVCQFQWVCVWWIWKQLACLQVWQQTTSSWTPTRACPCAFVWAWSDTSPFICQRRDNPEDDITKQNKKTKTKTAQHNGAFGTRWIRTWRGGSAFPASARIRPGVLLGWHDQKELCREESRTISLKSARKPVRAIKVNICRCLEIKIHFSGRDLFVCYL